MVAGCSAPVTIAWLHRAARHRRHLGRPGRRDRPGHNPLLDAVTGTLRPAQLADANTVINICQRIAGALGIGLITALFTAGARTHGPVPALHATGLLLTATAALAAATTLLPGRPPGPAAAAG